MTPTRKPPTAEEMEAAKAALRESTAAIRLCDVKGCDREATERVREVEKPHIGVPVCSTHAFALTLGDFYEREEAS